MLCRSLVSSVRKIFGVPFPKQFSKAATSNPEKCSSTQRFGVLLGVYSNENDPLDIGELTPQAEAYNTGVTKGRLAELLRLTPIPKRGECRIFYGLEPNYVIVAVCGLGSRCLGYDHHELIDEGKEAIRVAAAVGCKEMQKLGAYEISVESLGNIEAAAEGASMGIWVYQKFKSLDRTIHIPYLKMFEGDGIANDYDAWSVGMAKASAQNLARNLMETPPNVMSPTTFAQKVVRVLADSGVNVEVKVRGWAESQHMNSFLTIAKGSAEPPIFLELSYYGSDFDESPIVLIGQGTTYNCGGLNLLPNHVQKNMRGDMCGAAVVTATCRAIAALRLPVNIRGLIPLCEHMIGCNSARPGDVIEAMNGKHLKVEHPDNISAMMMVDALLYAQHFKPKYVVDIGTIAPDIQAVFGKECVGVFTNSEQLWQQLKNSSAHTGDRVWRMPLHDFYAQQVCSDETVDITNNGIGRRAVSCKSAALLGQFVTNFPWMHIDAYGVRTTAGDEYPYLRRGMTGRPTRTIIEFIAQAVCANQVVQSVTH